MICFDSTNATPTRCPCGKRAFIGASCIDHAPPRALRLEILTLRARLAGQSETIETLRSAAIKRT